MSAAKRDKKHPEKAKGAFLIKEEASFSRKSKNAKNTIKKGIRNKDCDSSVTSHRPDKKVSKKDTPVKVMNFLSKCVLLTIKHITEVTMSGTRTIPEVDHQYWEKIKDIV